MDNDSTAIAGTYDAARASRPEAMSHWLDPVARHAPDQPQLVLAQAHAARDPADNVTCGIHLFNVEAEGLATPHR